MKEYKDKTIQELTVLLKEKREMLRVHRFGGAGSKTKNTREAANIRKEIARILTAAASKKTI